MGEWQDIASAPRDGEMLVTNGVRFAVVFRDAGMSSYRFFSAESQQAASFWPTHWQPLPAPPAKTEEVGQP